RLDEYLDIDAQWMVSIPHRQAIGSGYYEVTRETDRGFNSS
ncbi:Hypothetical protein DEACI_0072, partial [Acididesulfobacillus acetoxydans]